MTRDEKVQAIIQWLMENKGYEFDEYSYKRPGNLRLPMPTGLYTYWFEGYFGQELPLIQIPPEIAEFGGNGTAVFFINGLEARMALQLDLDKEESWTGKEWCPPDTGEP